MFENDSVQAFHQTQPKKPQKTGAMGLPAKDKRDEFIMDTNSSSIVSKRSVEKLYYPGEPEYFRYFVKKFQRRSPLINRGYWLRMKAIDRAVRQFLTEPSGKKKLIVNLGCGYDPLPFQYLGKHSELCADATFLDVDYPQLMQRKLDVITQNAALRDLLPNLELGAKTETVLGHAEKYVAIGCDLRCLDDLEAVLRRRFNMTNSSVAILFTSEVATAYMTKEASDALLRWAIKFDDVRFCLLEQHLPDGPDHPFAQTMLKHFEKLRTPLHAIGTMAHMRTRFVDAGWLSVNIRSLWELWSDDLFLTPQQRADLDKIEPFDEWEEFALFGSHYFLLIAKKQPSADTQAGAEPSIDSDAPLCETATSPAYEIVRLQGRPSFRRFAAVVPSNQLVEGSYSETVGLYGGLGTRERLKTVDAYATANESEKLELPPLSTALMCHTITPFKGSDCLLVGGRSSPDKASTACWYRDNGLWRKVHDLPQPRYRHCAVAVEISGLSCVLVYGGKNSQGDVLDDWIFWTPEHGWFPVHPRATIGSVPEPRFGAAMAVSPGRAEEGLMTGGMRKDGTVINDFWQWTLYISTDRILCVAFKDHTEKMSSAFRDDAQYIGRFGAQLLPTPGGSLLIGGIAKGPMLTRRHEILNMHKGVFLPLEYKNRPLLIGFSAVCLPANRSRAHEPADLLVLGGGATCFSFGTYWNTAAVLTVSRSDTGTSWHLQEHQSSDPAPVQPRSTDELPPAPLQPQAENGSDLPEAISVPRKRLWSPVEFERVLASSTPVVLSGLNLGSCTQTWTNEYLKGRINAERKVVVHSSPSPHMNFQTKNFSYTTQAFGEFLDAASNGGQVYLRALSADKPSDKPTNLAEDFPEISADFELPRELAYAAEHAHSSPLRISGPVTMWLHYDVMANVLCQIRGRKRLLLFPPSDVTHLSFSPGASSSTLNPFTVTSQAHPPVVQTHPYEALLNPGDVLFIPPLWLHAAEPIEGLSVAVNVFFRTETMETGYAAGRDVYGNRDLAAYERGRRDLAKIDKGFEELPEQVRKFYLLRLADELRDMAEKGAH